MKKFEDWAVDLADEIAAKEAGKEVYTVMEVSLEPSYKFDLKEPLRDWGDFFRVIEEAGREYRESFSANPLVDEAIKTTGVNPFVEAFEAMSPKDKVQFLQGIGGRAELRGRSVYVEVTKVFPSSMVTREGYKR